MKGIWTPTWTAPSHSLNQCWVIVSWTLRNKFQWNFRRNSYIFIQENAFQKCHLRNGGHFVSAPMCYKCLPSGLYIYMCVHIPYTSSVIGCIYNGSVIQYWRSCTPSCSIGECAVPGLNAILCFLWFTNCVLLFDNNLILGCLWHWVFV